MSKAIRTGLRDLSLDPKDNITRITPAINNVRLKSKYAVPDEWVYGYRFKNRHFRLLAEKYNLDWEGNPLGVTFGILDWLRRASRVPYKIRTVSYRGRSALIVAFIQDDSRRRLELNEVSEEQMDRVRKLIGIPEGRKPKWFSVHDTGVDPDAEFSSDDEECPSAGLRDGQDSHSDDDDSNGTSSDSEDSEDSGNNEDSEDDLSEEEEHNESIE